MSKLVIKGGKVVCAVDGIDEMLDILVEDGMIKELGKDLKGDIEIDASGLTVLPGLVDMHCHLREPGLEYKEDIQSGTRSAAMGGFTSIACMPNTSPAIDSQSIATFILNRAKEVGSVKVYPIGCISKGMKGEELAEIGELKHAGCVGISDDGKPVNKASLMKKALQYASMFDLAVISHCEDMDLVDEGVMNEGYMSTILGLRGIPSTAEEVMVARDVLLAEYTDMPVHIAHVSSKNSVELIRDAKARGAKVTAETCPHYFTLTENACDGFDTSAKVNPPLRTDKDVEAIILGLVDGTIDAIATDHAPHHQDEKRCEFVNASFGMVGFETAFALSYTYLVKTGKISLSQLTEKLSTNPAAILRLNAGRIKVGSPADLTIIDTEKKYKVDISEFVSKSHNSPFDGFSLTGKVTHTIVNGNLIVNNGQLEKR